MKSFIPALLLISGLAACGGGGGGSPVTPPTSAPTMKPTYKVAIDWEPNNAVTSVSIVRRDLNAQSTVGIDSNTTPIMLTANSPYIGSEATVNDSAAAWITASPAPSPMPTASWSPSSSNLVVKPAVNPQFPDQVTLAPNAQTAAKGSIDASVGDLGTGTGDWLLYNRLALECHHAAPVPGGDNTPEAYTIVGGVITPATDTNADVYVDGPRCYGPFLNNSETAATLHFADGSVVSGTQFNLIASFTGGTTAVDLSTLPAAVVFKTKDGEAIKFELQFTANDSTASQGSWGGPVCVIGSCIDGT